MKNNKCLTEANIKDCLPEIINFLHIPKIKNVWGNEIVHKGKTYELETWFVEVPFYEDINSFIISARALVSSEEFYKLCKIELEMTKWKNYTLYQVGDWVFKTNSDGSIIKDNKVIFVKYALILKD